MISGISPHLLRGLDNETPAAQVEQLKQVTREFETIFLETILTQMRSATRGLSGEKHSFARQTYESWQDQMFARSLANSGGIGLAETLYRQLQQEQLLRQAAADE